MNAIVNAFAEQGLILGAILLLAIYFQAKIHTLSTDLRKEMSELKDDLRKEMSEMKDNLRKEMNELRKEMNDLRKEMGKLSKRLGRVEGVLNGDAAYEAVAEQPPGGESEPE